MTNNSRYCRSLGDQNASKTIPFGAAQTYMAYTREYLRIITWFYCFQIENWFARAIVKEIS